MLKLKITKEEFDKLGEDAQKLYREDDGDYVLEVSGLEDTGALKRAKDHEKDRRKDAEKQLREAQDKLESVTDEAHRKAGDIEKLEESWKAKLAKKEAQLNGEIEKLQGALQNQMSHSVAQELSTKLAGENAALLLPHVEKRLRGELTEEGKAVTRVLDAAGEVSALSVEELEKEIFTDTQFSAILIGSKGSGSGAAGGDKGASGAGATKLSEMTATEEAKFANENPEQYQSMLAQEPA